MGQIDGQITGANRRLAKMRVQCLNEALCLVSSSVLADNFVLRNPPLRQGTKTSGCEKTLISLKKTYFHQSILSF